MENDMLTLLPETVPSGFKAAEDWREDGLTQGHSLPSLAITRLLSKAEPSRDLSTLTEEGVDKAPTISVIPFMDAFASMVDPMFGIYPHDTKRDIRQLLKDRLIDWVAKNARAFFGPSTSRSISACVRVQNMMMMDVERFGEFVSFMMDSPVRVGSKVVVWHGYGSTSREPSCELVMKQQGVFVRKHKI